MSTFVLRRIIAHWVADFDIGSLGTEIDDFLRTAKRRAQERKIADLEAWRVFCGVPDDGRASCPDDDPDY